MSSVDGDGGAHATHSDFYQRDENVSFFPHNHMMNIDPTLTESQKDFLKYE
jgi:hypothetical protein